LTPVSGLPLSVAGFPTVAVPGGVQVSLGDAYRA